jgi:hypothetical protein
MAAMGGRLTAIPLFVDAEKKRDTLNRGKVGV